MERRGLVGDARRIAAVAVLLAAAGCATGAADRAAPGGPPATPAPLLAPATLPASGVNEDAASAVRAGASVVSVDRGALDGGTGRFVLDLPGTGRVEVDVDHVERRGPGDLTWYGRTAGSPVVDVVLTDVGGEIAGRIQVPGTTFIVTPAGPGVQTIAITPDDDLNADNDLHVPIPEEGQEPVAPATAGVSSTSEHADGSLLAVPWGASAGTPVALQPCRPSWDQTWVSSWGGLVYNPASLRCLRVPAGSDPAALLQVGDCQVGLGRQQWRLVS